ncbi:MAG: carbohydrate-binding domain-containing protein [Ruminococcus sp.]|nr:carbohydrate-binding domain-containing protein [Ruminococcus sp.]
MNSKIRKILALGVAILMVFSFVGCEDNAKSDSQNTSAVQNNGGSKDDVPVNQTPSGNTLTEVRVDYLDTSNMFSNRDTSNSYETNKSELITLKGDTAQTNAEGVSLADGVLTISEEGIYVLKGDFNGQIIVDAPDTDKIQLVLNGVKITSDKSAGIYVKQADKLFVTTADGSENSITATGNAYTDNGTNVDGAVFSKCDVSVNGKGTLNIESATNGIVSKDDVIIGGGTIIINAGNHGIDGKDSIRIADGNFTIKSGKDAIHSENADDTTKGFVYIAKGDFDLEATGDGISSSMIVQLEKGNYNIKTSGSQSTSSKGIKSETSLIIQGGSFDITSTDDGLHSSLNTVIDGGTVVISSSDDGIHSDNNVSINDGDVIITDCYEGLEGQTINITGGTVEIHASDDGMNAAGGNDQSGFGGMGKPQGDRGPDGFAGGESTTGYVNISGGKVTVYAKGDGIDANGTVNVSGGETAVIGPENGGNSSLDFGKGAEITGGTFIAVGAKQMAQNFTSSTQGAILVTVTNGSEKVEIKDNSGKVIYSLDPDINYTSVVFSSPEIKEGESYTVSANGDNLAVEMTSTIYGGGNGFGMGGGNFGEGGPGGMREPGKGPDGDAGNMPANPPEDFRGQLPEGFEDFNPEDFRGQLPEGFEDFNFDDFQGQFPGGMEFPQDMQRPVV